MHKCKEDATIELKDDSTKVIDNAISTAREKEEWRQEYMLTFVHDKDVYREGAESRQPEVDALNSKGDSLKIVVQNKEEDIEKNGFDSYDFTNKMVTIRLSKKVENFF